MIAPPAKAAEALRVAGEGKVVAGITAPPTVFRDQGGALAVRRAPVGRQPRPDHRWHRPWPIPARLVPASAALAAHTASTDGKADWATRRPRSWSVGCV
jgi:hypothetical protein